MASVERIKAAVGAAKLESGQAVVDIGAVLELSENMKSRLLGLGNDIVRIAGLVDALAADIESDLVAPINAAHESAGQARDTLAAAAVGSGSEMAAAAIANYDGATERMEDSHIGAVGVAQYLRTEALPKLAIAKKALDQAAVRELPGGNEDYGVESPAEAARDLLLLGDAIATEWAGTL